MADRRSLSTFSASFLVPLQAACNVAVVALTDISQDVSCPASARVSAARIVLELALKGVELEDLAVRVEELESQVTRV